MRDGRGFTLIELLVVISIIGLLSSVVLVSLNSARNKAKESSLKSHTLEFRKLLELEYLETGSYANLSKGWVGGGSSNGQTSCAARGFAGNYASQALGICNGIMGILGTSYDQAFFVGTGTGVGYSIMTRYPSALMYCVGSSGAISNQVPYSGPGLLYPGCFSNP